MRRQRLENMKKIILAMLTIGGCALLAQEAEAGTISFTGRLTASRVSAPGKTTTITFANPWRTLPGGTDQYSAIPGGIATTMKSISFTGTGASAVLTAPVIPQWKFTFAGKVYSFNLTSLDDAATTAGSIAMSGTGIAFYGALSAPATWSISGTGSRLTFRLSFATTTAVPDGGSAVALLGGGLVLIEGARRRVGARGKK
jgi:hypothetical protein